MVAVDPSTLDDTLPAARMIRVAAGAVLGTMTPHVGRPLQAGSLDVA